MGMMSMGRKALNPPSNNVFDDQEPFCKKVPGPPKTFYYSYFEIFFVCDKPYVSLWLKLSGGFGILDLIFISFPDKILP
jgi:hypothetical protein